MGRTESRKCILPFKLTTLSHMTTFGRTSPHKTAVKCEMRGLDGAHKWS
jgi:hypothetical protein